MIEYIRIFWYSQSVIKIPETYDKYLTSYNEYYNQLSPELKSLFLKRLYISLKFLSFEPVEFDTITEEMKVVILSALIQITLGLEKYVLKRFKKIIVVPNTYKFGPYEALLGHVDSKHNVIVLSWPSVQKGFIIPDDASNVALHEMAHALQHENHANLFFNDFFDAVLVNEWHKAGLIELYKIRKHKHTYLRKYAGQNMHEMFAVSMECFFEQPEAFQHHVPGLYHIMTKLLRQNPINIEFPTHVRF